MEKCRFGIFLINKHAKTAFFMLFNGKMLFWHFFHFFINKIAKTAFSISFYENSCFGHFFYE
jgi:hypothetical protein